MAFLGMRGTGDWVAGQRPLSWREQILYLYPNGMAPLTAILSMMGSEKVSDPEFYWWQQSVGSANGAVTGVFLTPDMLNVYVAGGVAGNTVYFRVALVLAQAIRVGHQVLLRDSSDETVDVTGKVVSVDLNGANSLIGVMLLENDDNSTTHDLSNCDHLLVMGNLNPEGGEMPDAVLWDPYKIYNKTQIFRNSLSITRTAMNTTLRTGDEYQKQKSECLKQHSIEMELAYLWSVLTERTGANGKIERTMRGLIPFIRQYAAANCLNYTTMLAPFNGLTWLQGGEDWLDLVLEQIFRYGESERLGLCGSGALLGINRLVKAGGFFQFSEKTTSYGIKVITWVTAFGTLHLKTHPLFSYDATTRNMIVVFEPKNLKYRFITDTTFYPDDLKGHSGRGGGRLDAKDEEYLTECSLEMRFPETCGILSGVGQDNHMP